MTNDVKGRLSTLKQSIEEVRAELSKKQKELLENRRPSEDSDLKECWDNTPIAEQLYTDQRVEFEEILSVVAQVPGEADGPSWFWIIKVKKHLIFLPDSDDREEYFLIEGWCDYTGWSCQSDAACLAKASNLDALLKEISRKFYTDNTLNEDYRELIERNILLQLSRQIDCTQPYGLDDIEAHAKKHA